MSCHTIRRNIFSKTASALHSCISAQTSVSLHQHIGSQNSIIFDDTTSRYLRTITNNATITNNHIMRDTRSLHDKIIVSDHCFIAAKSGTNNHSVLTNRVIITYTGNSFITFIVKILLSCCYYSAVINRIPVTNACTTH